MRIVLVLVLLATACGPAPSGGNQTMAAPADPAPTMAADSPEGQSAAGAAADGDKPGPDNRFISCPGHPRCPKGQEGY